MRAGPGPLALAVLSLSGLACATGPAGVGGAPDAAPRPAANPAERPTAPDPVSEAGAFTLTQNGTLIGTEEFTRAAARLDTELRVLNQPTLTSQASLRPDATVARIEVRLYPTGNPSGDPARTLAAVFGEGSVRIEQPIGEASDDGGRSVPVGALPYLNPSPSYLEQLVRRAIAVGDERVAIPLWSPAPEGGAVTTATVMRDGASVTIELGGLRILLETDADGRLLSGRVPSQGVVIDRR